MLQGLLSYAPGESISANMIKKYEQYDSDLETLKKLFRDYLDKDQFEEFFRGPTYHELDPDDPSKDYSYDKAKGYTAYNLHKLGYDDLKKEVEKRFRGTGAESDERYVDVMERFGQQRFLRRLKTSDNGAIYYQLHLEELKAILENQGRFYPFLKRDAAKIESLVSFRIPYYVGPLTDKNARQDAHGKNRFQWSERKPGMEDARRHAVELGSSHRQEQERRELHHTHDGRLYLPGGGEDPAQVLAALRGVLRAQRAQRCALERRRRRLASGLTPLNVRASSPTCSTGSAA